MAASGALVQSDPEGNRRLHKSKAAQKLMVRWRWPWLLGNERRRYDRTNEPMG